MVHDQTPCALVPGVGTFHHPALGQDDKAGGVGLDGEQIGLLRMRPTANVLVGRVAYDLDL
jgi:hypothetical protein